MVFCTLNQLKIDVAVDSWRELDESIESFSRTGDYSLQGGNYLPKRAWTFDTIPLTEAQAHAVQGWCENRGHAWSYENADVYSDDSGLSFTNASSSGTNAKFGSRSMLVASGQNSTVTTAITGRRSWSLWKRPASGTGNGSYTHFAETYDGSSLVGWSSTTTASLSAWYSTASAPFSLVLQGEDNAASAADARHDGVVIAPYVFTNSMVFVLGSRTAQFTTPGYSELDGDCIPDLAPVTVRAKVESTDVIETANGVFRRILHFRLTER